MAVITSPHPAIMDPSCERALEQLMLILFDRQARRIAFASLTPTDDDGEVGLQFARTASSAGTRTAYLSFLNYATPSERLSGFSIWSGDGHGEVSGAIPNDATMSKFAWRPNGPNERLMEPTRLSARFNREFDSFDCVACSIPPLVRAASDAPNPHAIAKACDGLVLVVAAFRDDLDTVAAAVDSLKMAGVNLLGTVLNERYVSTKPLR